MSACSADVSASPRKVAGLSGDECDTSRGGTEARQDVVPSRKQVVMQQAAGEKTPEDE